jgi:hypothetical protein
MLHGNLLKIIEINLRHCPESGLPCRFRRADGAPHKKTAQPNGCAALDIVAFYIFG